MLSDLFSISGCVAALTTSQLTKEEEATTSDEIQVRREDQDKINKFSTLHQKETRVEDELKAKQVSISLSKPR